MSGNAMGSPQRRVSEGGSISASLIRSIVAWCEALNGALPLDAALHELIRGLGAEAGLIVRTNLHEMRQAVIASADVAPAAFAVRPLTRPFADGYFGRMLGSARSGTLWMASQHLDDATGDPALGSWQTARRMKEFLVLVLSAGGINRDHVELHFRDHLTPDMENALVALVPDMVRVWAGRQSGLIARAMDRHRAPEARRPSQIMPRQYLLSIDNPAQLSRAEFRVCLLLSRGLLVQAVARELHLSEPTIRTHLRNIYAKTECGSLAELVFRLMDGRPQDDVLDLRSA